MPTLQDLSDARAVLRSFLDANVRKDEGAMRRCLSRRTLEENAFQGPEDHGSPMLMGEAGVDGDLVVIPLLMHARGPDGRPTGEPTPVFHALMVNEAGAWKFDLAGSQDRMMEAMREAMGGAMEQMGEAMGSAMEGMAEALSSAFGDSSGDEERDAVDELLELQRLAAESGADDESDDADDDEPAPTPQDQNDELFRTAVESLAAVVPTWEMQIELAVGRTTPLTVDWDSLNGQYALVNGMVHAGVSPALGAICALGFNPDTKPLLADAVSRVKIQHVEGVEDGQRVRVHRGELRFMIDASPEAAPLPDGALAEELRAALAGDASAAASEPPAFEIHGDDEEFRGVTQEDRWNTALEFMSKLEELMHDAGVWPGEAPPDLEVKGAFGCENMAFTQWLGWVLIPRVREIVETRGSFPSGSMVATYAARELDGSGLTDIVSHLYRFDRFINAGAQG